MADTDFEVGDSLTVRSSTSRKPSWLAQTVSVDCLLPNGLLVPLECTWSMAIGDVKEKLWDHCATYPGIDKLKKPDSYVFMCVNVEGEIEELLDEQKTLGDVHFFHPMFKVVERRGNKQEKLLNFQIGSLIGKALVMYGSMKVPEVDDFRRNILEVCHQATEERAKVPEELNVFPPDVENCEVPPHVKAKLTQKGTILVNLYILTEQKQYTKFTLSVEADATPEKLVAMGLRKKAVTLNLPVEGEPADYLLKVRGRMECLIGRPLLDFRYIRRSLAKERTIELMIVKKTDMVDYSQADVASAVPQWHSRGSGKHGSSNLTGVPVFHDSSFSVHEKLKVTIVGATNVNAGDVDGLYVRVGLYHGGQQMCPTVKTAEVSPTTDPEWKETLNFDIAIQDIPRAARLCFTLYGMWNAPAPGAQPKESRQSVNVNALLKSQSVEGLSQYGGAQQGSSRENRIVLAWVNMTIFDYNNVLRSGTVQLTTWPCGPDEGRDMGNPIGTTVSNPDKSAAPSLSIAMPDTPRPIVFPSEEIPVDLGDLSQVKGPTSEKDSERLRIVIAKDPLAKLSKKEKALLWKYRFYCKDIPQALPKFLRSVPWNNKEIIAQVHALLRIWAPVSPEDALELLDSQFADSQVRAHAVTCLERLGDDKFVQYLLQLVQVLKYEGHLDCDLARFLLRRALQNRRIGHYFFWYLRSEMHLPDVSVRYGLLLEAYCRGCGSHMQMLARQTDAMAKLVEIANMIKKKSLDTREKKLAVLRDALEKVKLQSFQLPLTPMVVVSKLKPERCSFMDSKKLPLWLVFENDDTTGRDVYIIFKSGDDLRQDMLTLQMIEIMDNLWQQNGLDLRMLPYGCLSTGDQVGMIEVVLNSNTICNIQKEKGGGARGAFKDEPLRNWLQEQNTDAQDFEKAVENFTLSCAGYCVATYVLGIGDRHNDNIMMTKSGQIFHIDFGHFLGNFKSKFGIKRERVPFVLTPDFVYVMSQKEGTKGERFKKFKELCKRAYQILRQHATLFINLFAMMLSTGIPQLRTVEDINYLREALCLTLTEEEAAVQFEKKIDEALSNSLSTRLNWAVHGMVH